MISVVLLSHTINDTNECIKNLENNSSNNIEEVVIVSLICNNNEYKSEKFNIKKLNKSFYQYSFSQQSNAGIETSLKENDILILSDNCYCAENTIDNLEKALYSSKDIGIVTPITNIGPIQHYQSLNLPFESFQQYNDYLLGKTEYDESKNELRLRTTFLTVLIKRSLLDYIGNFDERFETTDYVSDDFCMRTVQQGYKILFCEHSFVYIKGNLYFNAISTDKNKFKEKWGFDPFYSLSIRNEILDKLAIDKDKKVNILEIGCACGSTLVKLKNIYKDCELYGIDIDENSIKIANHIENAVIKNADIESDESIFEDDKFDLIIALDVLEHLRDPWEIMKKFKKSLKKNGQIIISIPNIMHISIINNLIQGSWDYQDSGILDKTHLRFFTLKSMKQAFANIGCSEIYYFSIFAMLSNQEQNLIDVLANLYNLDSNQLKSYQYIITNKI